GYSLFSSCYGLDADLPSFPTRRSSDLLRVAVRHVARQQDFYGRQVDLDALGIGDAESDAVAQLIFAHPARGAEGENDLVAQLLRSEEHTSELQSRFELVCRLLLENKNP